MALFKSIETEYGIPATYWNIGGIQEDFKGKGAEVTFYGYADKSARDAGKQPLSAGKMNIGGEEYSADMTRPTVYQLMKQKPEFEGSEDC
jgi:hypothetical protein